MENALYSEGNINVEYDRGYYRINIGAFLYSIRKSELQSQSMCLKSLMKNWFGETLNISLEHAEEDKNSLIKALKKIKSLM